MTARDYWSSRNPTRHGRIDPMPDRRADHWQPKSARQRYGNQIAERRMRNQHVQLAPGLIVIWRREPWRVVEVKERPLDLWDEGYETAFAEAVRYWETYGYGDRPEKATWRNRPVVVVLIPDGEPKAKPRHLVGPASHDWPVLAEHYAVCVSCGQLPPCSEELADRQVEQQMAAAEVLMDIPAGHCLGCGEEITSRMRAVRFPGPNLWRPDLGDESAAFHARRECAEDVARYRDQFAERGGEEPQLELPTPKES